MKALVINGRNEILFTVDVPESDQEVKVAGDVTVDGAPVNVRTFKLTRSAANFKRASRMDIDGLSRREYRGFVFYVE